MSKISKIIAANKKIEKAVVGGYKAIENGVVSVYKNIEDKFVETFLAGDEKLKSHSDSNSNSKNTEEKTDVRH